MSPLFFIIFTFSFYLFFRNDKFLIKRIFRYNSKKYIIIWSTILIGLSIWFFKAPVFRYGSFYIISFVILTYILILDFFFKEKKSTNLKFFKVLFLISLFFFVTKNSLRIYKSENNLFPKTVFEENIQNFNEANNGGLQLLKVKEGVCYYTKLICSQARFKINLTQLTYLFQVRRYQLNESIYFPSSSRHTMSFHAG